MNFYGTGKMKSELEDIVKGATWQNIYDCLWTIATVRYVTREQLVEHFPDAVWRMKIATKKKMDLLVKKGFLRTSSDGVMMATSKSFTFLTKFSGKNLELVKLPKGTGLRDSIYNTDVLLQIIRLSDFHALFYPVFHESPKDAQPFLIPDGAVVFKKDSMAKLVFLEIEREKPDWQNILEGKRRNYGVIAEKTETWSEWWKNQSQKLGLRQCEKGEFGFVVWCIGEFKADWPGWKFKESL